MDAITLLRKQHAEVKSLFAEFEKTDDLKKRQAIFEQIADDLAAHCEIEEKLFYPAIFIHTTIDLLKEAVEEHLSAKRVIADLLDMAPSDSQYEAKVLVLKELIEHHVKEEHEALFPKVRKAFPSSELKVLGQAMDRLFDELIGRDPRKQVPSQTGSAAPLPAEEMAAPA
ncbi:MAG: hemerythrin domain-containing protein [Archangium sp.]|nr:hemerythrin domain-containing protein [Archangium sp.]